MNRFGRLSLLLSILALAPPLLAAQSAAASSQAIKVAGKEQRQASLDVILLIDKSLSMASFFDKVKSYAASQVLEPILGPGDRLIVETVYGKVDRLLSLTISSEQDKAKAIRALNQVKADGRFTDLGAALDAAKRDLDELGQPSRPKYVLLLTDERQEAPAASQYQAIDHKLVHPSLTYMKRVDLGDFRAITVGVQVADKVNAAAVGVMQFLLEPPSREIIATKADATPPAKQDSGGAAKPGPGARKTGDAGGSTAAERALPAWLMYVAAAILIIALAGVAMALLVSKKRNKDKQTDS